MPVKGQQQKPLSGGVQEKSYRMRQPVNRSHTLTGVSFDASECLGFLEINAILASISHE